MSETLYVGKGKQGKFGVRISVCLDEIFSYAKDNIEPAKNGKKYINLEVNQMRNEDAWKNTHTVKIDTWKPEPKTAAPQEAQAQQPESKYAPEAGSWEAGQDIPF